MKKLKIIKNPLKVSVNQRSQDNIIELYPNTTQSKVNILSTDGLLQHSNGNYSYNINKLFSSKGKTTGSNHQNVKNKLTFDNVFNPKPVASTFIFPQAVPTIPPIIIGNLQNQPQISININNYNINNYSSSVNKSKVTDHITSPNKQTEPIKIFYSNANDNIKPMGNSRIKLVKKDKLDDSFSILPHSHSNIIKKAKSVYINLYRSKIY
jgi:hypothetical protein